MEHNVDILAKLMASEDISIIHEPDILTASFDIKNRILRFPIFNEKMSKEIMVGFTAHEVGHSLFTPLCANDLMRKYNSSLVNIVEDIRIEKMIKSKFPGSKRFFYRMYQELVLDFDFFGTNKSFDITGFSFVDRLNVSFKIGESIVINEWSKEEQVIVDFLKTIRTIDDVEIGVKMITDFIKNQNESEPDEPDDSEDGESEDDDSEDGESNNDESEDDDSEDDESEDGESEDDDSEDGESEDYDSDESNGVIPNDNDLNIVSVKISENKFNDFIDFTGTISEFSFPSDKDIYIDNSVLSAEFIKKKIDNYYKLIPSTRVDKLWSDFNQDSKSMIAHLVSGFERKKAAEVSRKTSIKKTGKLNVNRLSQYKFSEDIFLGREVVSSGKNHGFLFFLDFSSSMRPRMNEVVKQILVLSRFAKKCHLPFKVFTYTTLGIEERNYVNKYEGERTPLRVVNVSENDSAGIIEVLSSDMTNNDFNKMSEILFKFSDSLRSNNHRYPEELKFTVYGTPTLPTIAKSSRIIGDFKSKFNVEVCNVMYFSDGENAHHLAYYYDPDNSYTADIHLTSRYSLLKSIYDKQTKKSMNFDYYRKNHKLFSFMDDAAVESYIMMDFIAKRHNVNVIYFFMNTKKDLYSRLRSFQGDISDDVIKSCRSSINKYNFGKLQFGQYIKDTIFIADQLEITSKLDLNGVESKKLKTAFRNGIKKSNNSKLFANTFIDMIIK